MSEKKIENKLEFDADSLSRRELFWSLGLFFSMLVIITGLMTYVLSEDDLYYTLNLTSSLTLIDKLHTDETGKLALINQARDAIFDELDRYSGYVEPQIFNRVTEEFSGSYGGIGITVAKHDRGILIISVREGGPAARAGILSGDIIIRADSINLGNISTYNATFLLRGEEGTYVDVSIARNNFVDTLEFNLQRKKLKLIHIPYAGLTDNGSLYIRILDFETGLKDELEVILDSLYFTNRRQVKAVILDLRGNPGGLLTEATEVSDIFLEKGFLIVGIKGRSIWNRREYYSSGADRFNGLPLAVLVDRGSASASEILAGSLKYAGRAILVGDTTFGKGLVQQYSGFPDGSGIRLTTSRYYFEGGVYLNDPEAEVIDSGAGIPPDYYFKAEEHEPFPMQVESWGLLREYAINNADEILEFAPFTNDNPPWHIRFKEYSEKKGYKYISDFTSLSGFVKDLIIYENRSENTYHAIEEINNLALVNDAAQFEIYRDYIKRRLFQIAVEMKLGTRAAYHDIIVPYRPEIILAEKALHVDNDNGR